MNQHYRIRPALRALPALLLAGAIALTPVTARADQADQVERLISEAGKAWNGGELKRTLDLLAEAITMVQNRLSGELAGFLPGDIEGWERGTPEVSEFTSDSGGLVVFGNLFSAAVVYTRTEGEGRVAVNLTNQPELTGIARANLQLLENPFFRERSAEEAAATGQVVEAYALGQLNGMKQWREAEGAGEITLFVGDVLLQAEGTGLGGFEELEAIISAADTAGLAAFAGGSQAR